MNQEIYKTTFPALTGFRFLSALLVFVFHYNPFGQNTFIWGICNEMYIGVGMFFVLSGFLITYNYYDTIKLDGKYFRNYFIRRFARIYPIYFLLTLLYFVYHFIKRPIEDVVLQLFLNIFLLKGFSEKFFLSGVAQAWSLTTEECFYICAPFIFWLIKFERLFWLQAVAVTLTGVFLVLIFQSFPAIYFFESFHFLFIATFFGRCFEFFVGIQMALWIKKRNLCRNSFHKRLTLVGLILIMACLFAMSLIRSRFHIDHASSHPVGLVMNNVFLAFSTAVLLAGLVKEKTFLSKILSNPFVVVLGKSSYAFYLIHAGLLADYITRFTLNSLFLKFILLQIAALGIFFLVEKPLNSLVRNSIRKRALVENQI
jgi:peptidoglycan/LPS O-acetylase OafA/YrhL